MPDSVTIGCEHGSWVCFLFAIFRSTLGVRVIMTPQDIWNAAKAQLEMQFDRQTYDAWLRKAEYSDYLPAEGVIVVHVHSTYARDMLQERYYRNIRKVLNDIGNSPLEIRFEYVKPKPIVWDDDFEDTPLFKYKAQQEQQRQAISPPAALQPASIAEVLRTPDSLETLEEYELKPEHTFDRFVVSPSNLLAHEVAKAVAEHPGTAYNPCVFYSNVGLGKTHLLQSIAHQATACGYRALFVPAEAFTTQLITAIRQRTTAMFQQTYRKLDFLIIDDIQFLIGKEGTQEEFFHTFNALVQAGRQIVIATDRHPKELTSLSERLRSRLQGGMVADISAPNYEARFMAVQMWAEEEGIMLNHKMIDMVANNAPANFRDLRGAFMQIKAQMLTYGGNIPMQKVEQTLERYTAPRDRVTVEQIIAIVAQKHGFTSADLLGKRRTESLNNARQIAMFLAREMTDCSLPMIGDSFGGRSHTTVLHGCNKLMEDMAKDKILCARVEKIRSAILLG